MLDNKTVRGFIDELASNSPAPGGGSVAALAASIASALNSMVFNLTVGKKVYKEYSEEDKNSVDNSLRVSQLSKDEFLDLMNKDTEEFLKLMKAFKLPKSSDEEKKYRSQKIQEGYKAALEVPFELAKKAYNIYDYIFTACKLGNKNAISDAGVAALMLQAAIESAVLNVKINLSCIKDEKFSEEVTKQCEELIEKGRTKRDDILSIVNTAIN